MVATQELTGHERCLSPDEFIVSKTDLKGKITYVNRVFVDIAGFSESELLGAPHNIIRHPAMPGGVFRLLWQTIQSGSEIFAYVVNRCKNGDHYWVFAHVTPSFDANGKLVGYHSNRRAPERAALDRVTPLYEHVLSVEAAQSNQKQAAVAGLACIEDFLAKQGVSYDEFVFSL